MSISAVSADSYGNAPQPEIKPNNLITSWNNGNYNRLAMQGAREHMHPFKGQLSLQSLDDGPENNLPFELRF